MRTQEIGKHKLEVYESIEDLPILRFHKYQKYLLIDGGIGGTIEDYDRHMERVNAFLSKGDTKNAIKEMNNMRQNIYFIQSEITPKMLAFVPLVKSIDGEPCDDLTDDGIMKTADRLRRLPYGLLTRLFLAIKKKNRRGVGHILPQRLQRVPRQGVLRETEADDARHPRQHKEG